MITSRLSTLLVRDGIVPVKKMELAFQRQVIYGGGLDTVLLEMGALHEERLWHYLSLATGLPVAELDMLEYIDPRGAQVCPRELAEDYQVAPLGLFGEALRLLVTDPVDLGRLEDLATVLSVPIQPFVVPEFRFHMVVERLFGVPVAPRFAALSRLRSQARRKEASEQKVVVDGDHPKRRTQPFGKGPETLSGAAASSGATAQPAAKPTGGAPARRTGDTWPGGSRPRLPGLPPEARKSHHTQTLTSGGPATSVRTLGQPPPPPLPSPPKPPTPWTGSGEVARTPAAPHEPPGLAAAREAAAQIAPRPRAPTPAPVPAPAPMPEPTPPGQPTLPDLVAPSLTHFKLPAGASSKATLQGFMAAPPSEEILRGTPPEGARSRREDSKHRDTQPFQIVPESGVAAGEVESAEEEAVREARSLGLASEQRPYVSPDEHAREQADERRPATTTSVSASAAAPAPAPLPGMPVAVTPARGLFAEDELTDEAMADELAAQMSSADQAELRALEREMAAAGALEDAVSTANGHGPRAPEASAADEAAIPTEAPHEHTERIPAPWRGAVALDPTPLAVEAASQVLLAATDRDAIFHALLRAARGLGTGAALFLVQGDAATGKLALREDDVDDAAVAAMRVPIIDVPVFVQAIEARTIAVGLIDGPAAAALTVLGAHPGVATAALPLVLRDRVVALVLVHRGDRAMTLASAAPLNAVGTEAALALSRLIVRAKELVRARLAEPEGAPAELPSEPITLQPEGDVAGVGDYATPDPDAAGAGAVDSAPEHDPRRTAALFEAALAGEHAAEAALRARASRATLELSARFPGPLHDDRFQGLVRPLTASQHGPLLALAVRLGVEIAAPTLLKKLGDLNDGNARYYAALLAGEIRSTSLLTALVERVFDPDKSIRAVALESLLFYPAREVDAALVPLRQALKDDPPRVRAAAYALEKLRDVSAIPGLISALEVGGATAEECRRTLIELTKADFGIKSRKWQSWWEENRGRPRIEWMLDGLGHAEDRIRLSASEELRRLTGEHFGYVFDMPRRERDEAHERWRTWWRQTGRDRFLGPTRRS